MQVIEDSSKDKGATRKSFSNLLYLSNFMFELCYVNVWKVSNFGESMAIFLYLMDLEEGLVLPTSYVKSYGASLTSLLHSFTHGFPRVDGSSWQGANEGSYMGVFGIYISHEIEYGGDMQTFDVHSHLLLV